MPNQVLSRKYRPQNFVELVGQDNIVKSLIYSLDNNTLHHTYIFSGTRGIGKTSLARLLSKSINCIKGISSHPCQICNNCIEITNGSFIDLIEIDAASHTKVEEIKSILDNIKYMPQKSRYKIYIIDEVHMLSNHSFNALLKCLEEPPNHVKFILATTHVHKIPKTILSRCIQFKLESITNDIIFLKIKNILNKENIIFEEDALNIIAHEANGSLRDGLNLIERAIILSSGQILYKDVKQLFGYLDSNIVDNIILCFLKNDQISLIKYINNIINKISHINILNKIAETFYYANLFYFKLDNISHILPCSYNILIEINKQLSHDKILKIYFKIIKYKKYLVFAPTIKSGIIMSLLNIFDISSEEHSINNIDYTNTWKNICDNLNLKGSALQIVLNSSLVNIINNTFILNPSDKIKSIIDNNIIIKIENALSKYKTQSCKIKFLLEDNIIYKKNLTPKELNQTAEKKK